MSMSTNQTNVVLYTDGACRGNPGPGGWGVVLRTPADSDDEAGQERLLKGAEAHTTNNVMELTAVIRGLEALKWPCDVAIYSDSKYVIQGMTEWIHNWRKRNWKTASGSPVKNKEHWVRLAELCDAQLSIDWNWVKGHSGDEGNELADSLANQAIDEM